MNTARFLPLLLALVPASCGAKAEAEAPADVPTVESAPFVGSAVQADVRSALEALYSGDTETVIGYTTPQLLDLMGGKEIATKVLGDVVKQLGEAGLAVESLAFPEEPVFFSGAKHDFAFVTTLSIIKAPLGRAESLNFQLGSRPVGTERWYFTEGSRLTLDNIHDTFPDYPLEREFPKTYRKKL